MSKKDINVALITFQGRHNYGNRLQNYATERIYEELGFSPVSLVLNRRERAPIRAKRAVKKLLRKVDIPIEMTLSQERLKAFDSFNSLMTFRIVQDLNDTFVEKYDFFSVGSDQIWYLDPNHIDEDWRFMQFVPPRKRLTISPSLGMDNLGLREGRRLRSYLFEYPYLSVREYEGAEIIKKYVDRDAVVTCDPTLVLPAEKWRAVADDHLTPDDTYVFVYLLGGAGAEANDVLEHVTDHGRIPVVPLSDRQKPGEPDAGPAEFISLVDRATHVVTDSFHAAVFSSILQTPLTIVRREGGASMFSRLETLSKTLGIEEKVCGSPEYDLSRAGDYEGVPEAIDRERQRFMSYLEGCLDGQLPGWREAARG